MGCGRARQFDSCVIGQLVSVRMCSAVSAHVHRADVDIHTPSKGNPQLIAQFPPEENEGCSFFVEWRTNVSPASALHRYAIYATFSGCLSHRAQGSRHRPLSSTLLSNVRAFFSFLNASAQEPKP